MMPHLTWQPSSVAWLIAIAGLIAAVHCVFSYYRARPAAGAKWARWLAIFRLAAIVLLGLAAFQPTIRIEQPASRSRQVILMVDASRSMGVIDSTRSLADLTVFAESIGQVDPALRDRPTGQLLARFAELAPALAELRSRQADLSSARSAGNTDESVQANVRQQRDHTRVIAESLLEFARQSQATAFAETRLKAIVDSIANGGKAQDLDRTIEAVVNELRRREQNADDQLARSDAEVKQTVERLKTHSRLSLAKLGAGKVIADLSDRATPVLQEMQNPLRVEALVDLVADQPQSPILQALRRTVERVSTRDVEAILFFTDGRSTEPQTAIPPLLSAAGIPVYPVLCAPLDRWPDVRIVRIDAPSTVLTGEKVAAVVHVKSTNAEGRQVKVTLASGADTQTRTITLGASDDLVPFDVAAAASPEIELKATIEPLPGETLKENNASSVKVNVVDQKIRVMLVAGVLGWDAQYLRNILSRTPWVQLQDQSLQQNEACRFAVDQFAEQDVIVLAGVPAAAFSTQQLDAIHRAASEQSKSVLLLGLDPDLLRQYARSPLLSALLPYRIDELPTWRQGPADEPTIRPVPTPLANLLPFLKLDETADASMRRWLARPLMYRVLNIGQLKPGAAILLADRASQTPLLIESVVGAGRAMMLAIDETWRWRRDSGGDTQDRFWLQLVRHLAEPLYNVSHDGLSLGADRQRVIAGQTVDLRARTPAGSRDPVTLVLKQGDNVIENQTVTELLPGSGRWAARVSPQSPGEYEVVLKQGGKTISLGIPVLPADESELADVSPDPALLRRIASATGGKLLTLEEAGRIAPVLGSTVAGRVDIIQYAVWCSPYLFGLIVACLGLEWAMRKQLGLV